MGILKGYVNKENNSNKIYSREDIGAMSQETYAQNEKAIDYQMKTVGVPTRKDLENSSDVVYVHSYKRQDGTEVTDYYRSKPDGGCFGTDTPPDNLPGGGPIIDENPYPLPTDPPYPPTDPTKEPIDPTTAADDMTNFLSAIFDFIKTGDPSVLSKVLTTTNPDDSKNKKDKDKNGDDSDDPIYLLLDAFKALDSVTNSLLTSVVNAMPEGNIVTDVVKSLVQYKMNMCQTLETLMDPKKGPEMIAGLVENWVSTAFDFTKKLVTGDFKDINLTEVAQNLELDKLAYLVNPLAGVVATMAIDVAPKVIGIIDATKTGDKETMVNDAMGAFVNCMGVVGQLKGIVGDKIAGFSKDVSAEIYNDATQTYDNLGQMQDLGYKYENFVKADMMDNASETAEKLNTLSADMLKGTATGEAANIDYSKLDVDGLPIDNANDVNIPSNTVLQGGISKTDYPDNIPSNLGNYPVNDESGMMASLLSQVFDGKLSENNVANAQPSNFGSAQNQSANAFKNVQAMHKQKLDSLLQKVTTAKNQDEYSKLLKEYSQQKEQYQKIKDLTNQLGYATQSNNYNGIGESTNNYTQQNSGVTSGINQSNSDGNYNNKLNELINNALGIQPASAEEIPNKSQFGTSPDGGPMLKTGLSYNNGASVPNPVSTKIEGMAGTGEAISASRTFNDLIKAMGKDSAQGQQVLKKVMKTFNSQFGRSIQASYQSELRTGVKKILNECMDSMKAMKLAGEIAEKTSKYLAWAYIFEQTAEGYYSGGSNEAKKKFINAGIEITANVALEIILTSYLGIEALPAFAIILIAEFILNKFKLINLN